MRRTLRRILTGVMTLVIVVLVVVIAIQLVLWSDWPRRQMIAALQNETGLIVDAGSLRTGWFGRTELRDVTLRMPLEAQPIAAMPSLIVEHTSLLPMLIARHIDVRSIVARDPQLRMARTADGEWNLLRMIRTWQARAVEPTRNAVHLPSVTIENAAIEIVVDADSPVMLPPVHLNGSSPAGGLEYQFSITAPGFLQLNGRMATLDEWSHEFAFTIEESQELFSTILQLDLDAAMTASGQWRGQFSGGALSGAMEWRAAQFGPHTLRGTAAVRIAESGVVLSSPDLHIQSPLLALDGASVTDEVYVSAGTLTAHARTLRAEQLLMRVAQTTVIADAAVDLTAGRAALDAKWDGRVDAFELTHNGSGIATIQWPMTALGQHRIGCTVHATKRIAGLGEFVSQLELSAAGASWQSMTGRIAWPMLIVRDDTHEIQLSGLQVAAECDWPLLRVSEPTFTTGDDGMIDGGATFNALTQTWAAAMSLQKWTTPRIAQAFARDRFDFTIAANGGPARIDLTECTYATGGARLSLIGSHEHASAPPLQALFTYAWRDPAASKDDEFAAAANAQIDITGETIPLQLAARGLIEGYRVPALNGSLAYFAAPISAVINAGGATVEAANVALLSGHGSVNAEINRSTRIATIRFALNECSVREAGAIISPTAPIEGMLDMTGSARVPLHDPARAQLDAHCTVTDFAHPQLKASLANGQLVLKDNELSVADLMLFTPDRTGSMGGEIRYQLKPQMLTIALQSKQWPIENIAYAPTGVRLLADSDINAKADVSKGEVAGSARVRGVAMHDNQELGSFHALVELDPESLTISDFAGTMLDGSLKGTAALPLKNFNQSQATLEWQNIALEQIEPIIRSLSGADRAATLDLTGRVSGRAMLQPATSHRPPAPLLLSMQATTQDAHSGAVTFGDAELSAYIGPRVAIVDKVKLQAADGEIIGWGRLSYHGNEAFLHLNAEISALDVNQLAHRIKPDLNEVPGRINGTAAAGGYLRSPHRMFGQAEFTIRDSDLVNVPVFTLIHNTLSFSIGSMQREGHGRAVVRLEGDAIDVSRFEYFNRGTDVIGAVRIERFWSGGESPISGAAVGALRPLQKVNLPFFNDLDRAIKAVQTGAASVRIGGTLSEPEQKLVPFAEISDAFMRILSGSSR